jgi:hypothetical protein
MSEKQENNICFTGCLSTEKSKIDNLYYNLNLLPQITTLNCDFEIINNHYQIISQISEITNDTDCIKSFNQQIKEIILRELTNIKTPLKNYNSFLNLSMYIDNLSTYVDKLYVYFQLLQNNGFDNEIGNCVEQQILHLCTFKTPN